MEFLLGKESFYKVFSNDSYDWLKFHIFAWLGLNPDYANERLSLRQKANIQQSIM